MRNGPLSFWIAGKTRERSGATMRSGACFVFYFLFQISAPSNICIHLCPHMAVPVIPYRATLHNVFVLLQPDITQPPLTFIGVYSMPLAWLAPAHQRLASVD